MCVIDFVLADEKFRALFDAFLSNSIPLMDSYALPSTTYIPASVALCARSTATSVISAILDGVQ